MTLIYVVLLVIINIVHGFIIPTTDGDEAIVETPLSNQCRSLLQEEIEKYVEELKNEGMSSKNLTAEPTNIDDFSLDIDLPIQKVKWDYSNLNFYGLKYFFFMKFKLLDDLKFEYSIYWPYVRDERHYYCNGSALEFEDGWIPIFGNGTFNNVYVGLNLKGTGRFVINDNYLQMSNFSTYINAKKCNMKTTGYMGDPEKNDEANQAINRDCPAVLIAMRNLLNTTMSPVISIFYNQTLRNDKIKEIVNNYKKCETDLKDNITNIILSLH